MACNEIELCSYIVKEARENNIAIDSTLLEKYLNLYNTSIKSPGIEFNNISSINSTTNH